ncbi:MAG: sugar phosphate isomerase/epimerase family protein [Methanocorpusculum sp.]|nr:sugar phosphate isomerase/epimerase family protein [Methanocorpusculum sp.]
MKAAGLDSVEFWMETPEFWMKGAPAEELLKRKSAFPEMFPIDMHAPVFDLNPCSINPKVAALSADYTIDCIHLLEEAGGGIVTIHPGRRTAKRPVTPVDRERFHAYLNRVGEAVPKNVTVALENMRPAVNAHMTTPEEMRGVLDEYSWLSFTWDYAHAQSGENPFRFLELCGDRLVNIHASRGRNHAMHTPLDHTEEGNIFIHELKKSGYTGHITIEFEDLSMPPLRFEDRVMLLSKECNFLSALRCI